MYIPRHNEEKRVSVMHSHPFRPCVCQRRVPCRLSGGAAQEAIVNVALQGIGNEVSKPSWTRGTHDHDLLAHRNRGIVSLAGFRLECSLIH